MIATRTGRGTAEQKSGLPAGPNLLHVVSQPFPASDKNGDLAGCQKTPPGLQTHPEGFPARQLPGQSVLFLEQTVITPQSRSWGGSSTSSCWSSPAASAAISRSPSFDGVSSIFDIGQAMGYVARSGGRTYAANSPPFFECKSTMPDGQAANARSMTDLKVCP